MASSEPEVFCLIYTMGINEKILLSCHLVTLCLPDSCHDPKMLPSPQLLSQALSNPSAQPWEVWAISAPSKPGLCPVPGKPPVLSLDGGSSPTSSLSALWEGSGSTLDAGSTCACQGGPIGKAEELRAHPSLCDS